MTAEVINVYWLLHIATSNQLEWCVNELAIDNSTYQVFDKWISFASASIERKVVNFHDKKLIAFIVDSSEKHFEWEISSLFASWACLMKDVR